MYGSLDGRGGEDEGAPGVFTYWEGLIEGPSEGVKVGGVRGGGGALSVTVSEPEPRGSTVAEKPRGRMKFDARRTRAAMSGKVAAKVRASGWGEGDWRGAKKRRWAPGREGGPFLTGGAILLATSWGEEGFPALVLPLPPKPEPEAACT